MRPQPVAVRGTAGGLLNDGLPNFALQTDRWKRRLSASVSHPTHPDSPTTNEQALPGVRQLDLRRPSRRAKSRHPDVDGDGLHSVGDGTLPGGGRRSVRIHQEDH